MGCRDRAHEAEAETETARGPARIGAVEPLEDAIEIARVDADALVSHSNDGLLDARVYLDRDVTTGAAVLDGVVDEVGHGLTQSLGIAVGDRGLDRLHAQVDLGLVGHVLVEVHDVARHVLQIDGLAVEAHHPRLRLSDVGERVQHRQDRIRLLDHVGERLPRSLDLIAPEGDFGRASETRQRRAQIVGDVVEGLLHAADQALVRREHLVDEPSQRVELVCGRPPRDARREITIVDDAPGSRGEGADGRERPSREPRAAE